MTRGIGVAVTALLLALAGGAALAAGMYERTLAAAQADMASLGLDESLGGYVGLSEQLGRLPWLPPGAGGAIVAGQTELQYWRSDYRPLAEVAGLVGREGGASEAALQLLAANAVYRQAQLGPQDRATVLRNLDAAVRGYAEALRMGAQSPDAAYNYEFVVRLRSEITSGKRRRLPEPTADGPLHAGRMHGLPGGPPKAEGTQPFKIRIPRDARGLEQSPAEAAGTGFMIRKPG